MNSGTQREATEPVTDQGLNLLWAPQVTRCIGGSRPLRLHQGRIFFLPLQVLFLSAAG
jgi:hypothetical protein